MIKMIKKNAMMLVCAIIVLMSCGHRNVETASEEAMPSSDTLSLVPDGYDMFVALQDVANQMNADLFAGQNDALLQQLLPDGSAPSSINAFLLKGKGKVILFDAGMGAANGGMMMQKLDSLQIAPEQVTDICITHFHFDHIGGLLTADGKAQFPAATLHVADAECDAWLNGALKQNNGNVKMMLAAYGDRVERFTAGDTLLGDIVTIAAPGHTPGHVLYDLGSVLIVGDLLHAVALQLPHPEFSARYDNDQQLAAETRQSVLKMAKEQHRILAGMHFPYPFVISF